MPLINIEQINPSRLIGIWHITENLDELLQKLTPHSKYAIELDSYKVDSKKLEWAAARLTVKKLAEKMSLKYQGVDKNLDGKPLLAGSNIELSLTHSYPYVAAIIDMNQGVGIDLEQPKEKLKAIAHKFLSDQEQHFIKDNIKQLCVAWCAKETLYKIYSKKGLIFKDNLLIDPFEQKSNGIITGSIIANDSIKRHKLEYRVTDDYVLTFNI
jgi:4'-phosphopantetheinyl transferase